MFEIGPSLREARMRRGLTPEDVQKAIRIRDRYLNALEEERWDMLPGDAYVKGFLRTYAEFLGLDGNLYVDEFNSRFAHHQDPAFVPEATTPVDSSRIGVLRPVAAIAAIVAAVAAVAAWQLRGSPSPPQSTDAGTTQSTSTTSTTPSTTQAQKPATTTTPPAAARPTHAVLTAATGRVWLQIRARNANGAILYEGTLEQGQSLPLTVSTPAWIRIGAPTYLEIRLGGRLLTGLPAHTGNVILSRDGLAPA